MDASFFNNLRELLELDDDANGVEQNEGQQLIFNELRDIVNNQDEGGQQNLNNVVADPVEAVEVVGEGGQQNLNNVVADPVEAVEVVVADPVEAVEVVVADPVEAVEVVVEHQQRGKNWTAAENRAFFDTYRVHYSIMMSHRGINWDQFAESIPGKTAGQCRSKAARAIAIYRGGDPENLTYREIESIVNPPPPQVPIVIEGMAALIEMVRKIGEDVDAIKKSLAQP